MADLSGANLSQADLSFSELSLATLNRAKLHGTNLKGAVLIEAQINGASLKFTKLNEANLSNSDLKSSDLSNSDLRGTRLLRTNFKSSSLIDTRFDSVSFLSKSRFYDSNLYHSYVDETITFRDAFTFQTESINEKEINERIGDSQLKYILPFCIKKSAVFNLDLIDNHIKENKEYERIFEILSYIGAIKYVISENNKLNKVIFYEDILNLTYKDIERYFKENLSTNYENTFNNTELICYELKGTFNNLLFNDGKVIEIKFLSKIPYANKYLLASVKREFLYNINREKVYGYSYETYNKLYNFYIANGDLIRAKHAHYRRGEAYRKLLLSRRGLKNKLRALVFDGIIQKRLVGYGDNIGQPIKVSVAIILLWSLIFWSLDGVYVSNEICRDSKLIDCLYLSLITFTSVGFSNVQPDINIYLMQPHIMIESILGVMMIALIIFVITYQISR